MKRPWFLSVRGNHDDMFLTWRSLRDTPQKQLEFGEISWFRNGGRWILKATEEEQAQLEKNLLMLPYVLIVPHREGQIVAAVHANLPRGAAWPDLLERSDRSFAKATWNRQRATDGGRQVDGLDAVVCGHTTMRRATWSGHFFHIDTGGWHPEGVFTLVTLDQVLRDSRN
jgi:serine/threonine protein phosphatase 1